jgi:hypothetical protein
MSDSNDFKGLSEEEIAAIKDDEGDDNTDDDLDSDDEQDLDDDGDASDEDDDDSDLEAGQDDDQDAEDESGEADEDESGADDDKDSEDDSEDDENSDDAEKGQKDKGDDSASKDDKPDADDSDGSGTVDKEYQGKIDVLDQKIVALDEKLDEGEIPFDDYKKQLLAIGAEKEGLKTEQNEVRTRALVREETARMSAETTWKSEQAEFFKENDYMKESPIVYDSFAREVNRLLGDKGWANKSGADVLAEAKKNVDDAFGVKPAEKSDEDKADEKAAAEKKAAGKKAVKNAKKASGKKKAPQTLKDVPASDNNMDGGAFDHLDKLDGLELEKALEKLTPEEMDAYARA